MLFFVQPFTTHQIQHTTSNPDVFIEITKRSINLQNVLIQNCNSIGFKMIRKKVELIL